METKQLQQAPKSVMLLSFDAREIITEAKNNVKLNSQ